LKGERQFSVNSKVIHIAALLLPATSLYWFAATRSRYPFDFAPLRQKIDQKLGVGTYKNLLQKVRPLLLMSLLCIFSGIGQFLVARSIRSEIGILFAELDVSAGIGFFLMRVTLARRGLLGESRT
jgi:hypothetical protein